MLSFDITDRNIRVVKGVENANKIKIGSAATVNVEEGLIVNGHVKDVPAVATLINNVRKMHKMPDKEAIVSISSNLTIFKEMTVPKSKGQDLQKTVKLQMQSELNLDDSYSVSYIKVGETDSRDGGEPSYKILATACPYEIVNSYREVFKLLGITLRSVMIGCNCITKVLLADTKIRSKMPLLAVQIDNNFISLNLYEQGQLSFSRFASIDAADYGYSDDYVFEAVNENIFRMLQFHRSRNTGESIENVIFYGDTHEYVRLTDELEKLDLKTSLINVPPQIHGHENLEFSLYANAIGAMFKRDREVEKINLLDTDFSSVVKNRVGGKNNDAMGSIILLAALACAGLIVGGTWGVLKLKNIGINKDINECVEYIESPDTKKKLDHHAKLLNMEDVVKSYRTKMVNANDAYESQPRITGEAYDEIEKILAKTCEDAKDAKIEFKRISNAQYNDGTITFVVSCDAAKEEYAQKLPAEFEKNLRESKFFKSSSYKGYGVTVVKKEGEEDKGRITFNTSVTLEGNKSAYHSEESSEEEN
ncbi:pilus assembly protein PilM [Ruminococcus flavefaciens]|uniref:pilus assembly protein PilM n=1 Tax=Ruminococcus flavefaciens TaxID=1265 RepID=UPI0026F15534|nr:pilus assembly protein PilM [Ruminococcus flavefaciens]MBR0515247.1 pilus assembly protein PilM [Eubacterium sp.]